MICALYFFALLFGFISAAIIGRWMAGTYGATRDLGAHFALLVVVGAPLVLGSLMHLYPDVFLNLLVLVPCLIWSMFLLYRGLPIVLQTTPEQGMLMASSMIGYLFVAFVSLLGISVCLWVYGWYKGSDELVQFTMLYCYLQAIEIKCAHSCLMRMIHAHAHEHDPGKVHPPPDLLVLVYAHTYSHA